MATKTPAKGVVVVSPVWTSRSSSASTDVSPTMSSTTVFHRKLIFGCSMARACMIFEALKVSRRWITVTLRPNLARNSASSSAESPPPMTAMSWSRKKNPSHVAQVESPWPRRRRSASRPSISDWAPVETITECARCVGSPSGVPTQILNGRSERSTLETLAVWISAPNRSAWARNAVISSGPMIPSGNPGKFSTSVVNMSCPPGWSLVEDGSPSINNGSRLARPV